MRKILLFLGFLSLFLLPILLIGIVSANNISIILNPNLPNANVLYALNFTQDNSCLNTVISFRQVVLMNSQGFATIEIPINNSINISNINFLCEWKDDMSIPRKIHSLSSQLFSEIWAKNITVNNINASGNVSASYFKGDGSLLTGISTFNSTYNAYAYNVSLNYSKLTFDNWNSTWDNSWVNIFAYNHSLSLINLFGSNWYNHTSSVLGLVYTIVQSNAIFTEISQNVSSINTTANIQNLINNTNANFSSIVSGGNISASKFIGDGSEITGVIASSVWNVSGTDVFPGSPSYNVGIGTSTPTQKLDVNGNVNITGNLTVSGRIQDNTGDVSPVGAMMEYAGSTAPTGWLFADGRNYSRTDYADLFAVIGTTYGVGDGSTTFSVPNMTGRYAVGNAGSLGTTTGNALTSTENRATGAHTHADNFAFSGNALPNHDHSTTLNRLNTFTDDFTGWVSGSGNAGSSSIATSSDSAGTPTGSITGSVTTTAAPNNVAGTNAPYIQLNYIIKT